MLVMAKERFFVKVEVSEETRRKFERLYLHRGLTQIEAATRVFDWFNNQDEMVQQAIFGQLPAVLADHARKMMVDGIIPLALNAGREIQDETFDEITEELKSGKASKRKGA